MKSEIVKLYDIKTFESWVNALNFTVFFHFHYFMFAKSYSTWALGRWTAKVNGLWSCSLKPACRHSVFPLSFFTDVSAKLNSSPDLCPQSCHRCQLPMKKGEPAVYAERAGHDKLWHPACFVCCTCTELLVDMIYFWKKGQLYCGRHYGDSEKPRCAGCDEVCGGKVVHMVNVTNLLTFD